MMNNFSHSEHNKEITNHQNGNFLSLVSTVFSDTYIVLCKPGLSNYCVEELKKFQSLIPLENVSNSHNAVIFNLSSEHTPSDLNYLYSRLSTIYSFSKLLFVKKEIAAYRNLTFKELNYLIQQTILFLKSNTKKFTFRVLCEGISGNETRIKYGSLIQTQIKSAFNQNHFEVDVNYKNPNVIFSLNHQLSLGEPSFTLGIRLNSSDLNKRDYRIFPHKASFAGDISSAIIQLSQISLADRLLFLYSRDAALAIEAIHHLNLLPIRSLSDSLINFNDNNFTNNNSTSKTISKSLLIKPKISINSDSINRGPSNKVLCIDDSTSNIYAASNNSKMAQIESKIVFLNQSLSSIKVSSFSDKITTSIVHLTSKNERQINEILSLHSKILDDGGRIIIITRPTFEIESDSIFQLKWQKSIPIGTNTILISCLQMRPTSD